MLKIHPNKFIVPLLLIPLVLVSIWFRNGLIHGGGEEGILYYNPQKTLQLSTSVWAEFTTGSPIIIWLTKVPVIYLATILEKTGTQPFIFQAILFYSLMVIGIISVYLLTLNLLEKNNNKLIPFISALFYLFNPFAFSQVWGRSLSTQYFAFVLLPLSLLLFALGIKWKKYIFGIFIALVSTVMATGYELLTFIVVYWLILSIYLIYRVLVSKEKVGETLFGIKFILFIFVFWCLFNSWWLVPLLLSFGSVYSSNLTGSTDNLGSLLGVSRSFTLDVIVRLLHKGYFFDSTSFSPIYSTLPFQIISFIPFGFVIVGVINLLKNQGLVRFRFFIVLLILGLFVSLGANFPTGWLFIWFFQHLKPLQAFRNPFEKFGLVFVLGYCPLFAYGLVYILERIKFKKLVLFLVLFLTCGVYAWPMWTGRVIAGPDKKIGLDVPTYYKDLRDFLKDRGGDFRLLMTPIWSGDGAYYLWGNGGRYQGADPMVFMLDQPLISNSPHEPYYYDFITTTRNYMQREDVVPALSLLRTKYLVDRKDAIFVTDTEKEQYKSLTSTIYPPSEVGNNLKSICQNQIASSKANDLAWLTCKIAPEDGDLSKVKYLSFKIKTDVAAKVEVSLKDSKDTRIKWDGRIVSDYSTSDNNWHDITIPIGTPTENDSSIDLSKVTLVEVWAQPNDAPEKSVGEINVSEIKLDPGVKKDINEFKKVADFGNLTVFEPINFNSPSEFGSLSSIDYVSDFPQLFDDVNKKRDQVDRKGFVLTMQNTGKNLETLPKDAFLQTTDKYKISNTRYWIKVDGGSGQGLLLLSKTFDPQWKVISGESRENLSGNFLDDLNLLKKTVLSEDQHFVVNGYANLWKIDGSDTQYAIVYMPQIVADISSKVSIFSILSIIGVTTAWGIVKLSRFHLKK